MPGINTARNPAPRTAYLALAFGVFSLGFSGIFVRWAMVPGVVAALYRMAIATVVLSIPFLLRQRRGPRLSRRAMGLALLGGLLFAGDLAFWSTGVVMAGATNPTLLANTAPLWVGLGAFLIFRERLRPAFWLGLAISMAGAFLILGSDLAKSSLIGLGSLYGLAAGVLYGAYFLVTQRGREVLDVLRYFWLSALASTLALLLLAAIFDFRLIGFPPSAYLSLLGLGLITQVGGWLALNYAQGHLPASLVAPTLLGQPVVTALLAWPLLGERLSVWEILGGAAVLYGVRLVHRGRRPSA
jgi:drug/metabolite transporter (DMT)-like permease